MSKTAASQFIRQLTDLQKKIDSIRLSKTETRKVLRTALQPVMRDARKLIPKPGYPGDKPEFKALRSTLRIATRDYGDIWYGAVGPAYPAGAHAHLVEGYREPAMHHARGKPTGQRLQVTPFIGPAMAKHEKAALRALERFLAGEIAAQVK